LTSSKQCIQTDWCWKPVRDIPHFADTSIHIIGEQMHHGAHSLQLMPPKHIWNHYLRRWTRYSSRQRNDRNSLYSDKLWKAAMSPVQSGEWPGSSIKYTMYPLKRWWRKRGERLWHYLGWRSWMTIPRQNRRVSAAFCNLTYLIQEIIPRNEIQVNSISR
jgi:hypothetical protein